MFAGVVGTGTKPPQIAAGHVAAPGDLGNLNPAPHLPALLRPSWLHHQSRDSMGSSHLLNVCESPAGLPFFCAPRETAVHHVNDDTSFGLVLRSPACPNLSAPVRSTRQRMHRAACVEPGSILAGFRALSRSHRHSSDNRREPIGRGCRKRTCHLRNRRAVEGSLHDGDAASRTFHCSQHPSLPLFPVVARFPQTPESQRYTQTNVQYNSLSHPRVNFLAPTRIQYYCSCCTVSCFACLLALLCRPPA